jgi:nucleoside 2-deoxyribosyltransferase
MKAYLAAMYKRRDELRIFKEHLEEAGIVITSRWLDENEPLNSQMGQHSKKFYKTTARIDLEDIDAADIMVFFSEDPLVGTVRGGRHVEFGYALAKGKPIYTVGPKENVFHYLKNVYHYDSINRFLKAMRDSGF